VRNFYYVLEIRIIVSIKLHFRHYVWYYFWCACCVRS